MRNPQTDCVLGMPGPCEHVWRNVLRHGSYQPLTDDRLRVSALMRAGYQPTAGDKLKWKCTDAQHRSSASGW